MSTERVISLAAFVAIVMVFVFVGNVAGFRVAGVATAVSGLVTVKRGALPVGIEGRPPSFYLTGIWATVGGLAIVALGCALILFAPEVVCYFSKGRECTP
jgi:hypothetical protein